MLKKVALIAVSVVAGLGLQGCTDEEVATGVVVVGTAVVAGALIAGAASGGGSSINNGPHGGFDHGGLNRGGGLGNGGFGRRHLVGAQDARIAALSQKYDLSSKASASVLAAFDTARSGNLGGFAQIGLSKDELQGLGVGKLPSDETLVRLGANMKTSPESLASFLQDVADQAIIESSKWMNASTPMAN